MWLLKGVLWGVFLFGVFTIIYFRGLTGPVRQNVAISVNLITSNMIYLPMYWAVFVCTVITSCLWARLLHEVFYRQPMP